MLAYYHDDDLSVDFREDHNSGEEVSIETLKEVGVLYFKCGTQDDVETIATEREYKNRDIIDLSAATFPGGPEALNEKCKNFYLEHLHEDEEIRYILEGEGYFDVRDKSDRWIRTKLFPGDLLILPAGIYHRFTLTSKASVKALRLFKDEPKWIALNRPVDANPTRESYLKSIEV
ncbi:unnamed protein product [Kuraishia capsulata CBS 1993]|uniref:Acireductone dioxygenase n=1 Tax=Kuraishia capsulata CBS 1993 TaxID=1382522 RepID=W6MVS6_9ASCO|nr:uncharacterized protein KUCA_T00002442001 [Kuraishia capsulata CBS 1993]CDK26470.1 unnamed protein product [Kuraishia capsulata CBS 1993]